MKGLKVMGKFKDLTGMKFGRLTVIERAENNKSGRTRWKCKCDCGVEIVVDGKHLRRGYVKSCGCFRKELMKKSAIKRNTEHGMSGTKIHLIWISMIQRCNNPNCKSYPLYGGRGIEVCTEWKNDFLAFYNYVSTLEHCGEEGYTLDRINVNGDYEPGNVRFADAKTQTRNRRNTVIVEYNNKQIPLGEASEKSGIKYSTLLARLHRGDRGEKLFRPVKS